MREEIDTRDLAMARIAARQHGVIVAAQLYEAGLDKSAISRYAKRGRLNRLYRGVYAVGHRGLSLHGRFMAAVLACGEGAVLSHGSAAVLWGLLKPLQGPIHASTPVDLGPRQAKGHPPHETARDRVYRGLLRFRQSRPTDTLPPCALDWLAV